MSLRVVLIGCSDSRATSATAARELFEGAAFRTGRAYAAASGCPWYVLSAKWGLLAPDDVVGPYDVCLQHQPDSYRRAWGRWVVERLADLHPGVRVRLEVHASAAYADPLVAPAEDRGYLIETPLHGLRREKRATEEELDRDAAAYAAVLLDPTRRRTFADIRALGGVALADPGLYVWFVDDAGAADLSAGLRMPLAPGLVYAGQAGGTLWPSGKRSDSSLWGRLTSDHFGRARKNSTLRRSFASILMESWQREVTEAELTSWMIEHLTVSVVKHRDRDSLRAVEHRVLALLDPPLNLEHVPRSELRIRLSELRRAAQTPLS